MSYLYIKTKQKLHRIMLEWKNGESEWSQSNLHIFCIILNVLKWMHINDSFCMVSQNRCITNCEWNCCNFIFISFSFHFFFFLNKQTNKQTNKQKTAFNLDILCSAYIIYDQYSELHKNNRKHFSFLLNVIIISVFKLC